MKTLLVCALAVLSVGEVSILGQSDQGKSSSWSGVIVNSSCTVDDAFAEDPKCTNDVPGTKFVLYDDTTRQLFDLDPQAPAMGHVGHSMVAHGTLEGSTIHLSSLERLTAIGLPVGRKAPPFAAHDQFGKVQTLDTLKGEHGTVLLFFRSADW